MSLSVARASEVTRERISRRRQGPRRVRTTAAPAVTPTVYFCTPDNNVPTGGIRVIYRHVDLLNAAGIRAAVLHRHAGFRCSWFEHSTRVAHVPSTMVAPNDVIVVTELDGALLLTLPTGVRQVIFNQAPHLTWQNSPEEVLQHYRGGVDLAGMITVSAHGAEALTHAFPQLTIRRVHNSVDPGLFYPSGTQRARRIAYMPRRGREEAHQVLGILHSRGALDGWEVVALDGLSQAEVGEQLRSTMVFLSFAHREGFGLPAAEAMACADYVVGFHGFGGREYFQPQFSCPVESGDVFGFARSLERVLRSEESTPGWCEQRGTAAAAYIAEEYAPGRERDDVVSAYREILRGAPRELLVAASA